MRIKDVIAYIDGIKPNAFSDEVKMQWINEVEGFVQTDVMLIDILDIVQYKYPADYETELLVPAPHSKIYYTYLTAMVDFANGEYNKYANTMQIYNTFLGEYVEWYTMKYRPADGMAVAHGYYLSAYGIAVKHGYTGTEEEWLEALRGPKGDPFEYEDFTPEQLEALRGPAGEGRYTIDWNTVTLAEIDKAYSTGKNIQLKNAYGDVAHLRQANPGQYYEFYAMINRTAASTNENSAEQLYFRIYYISSTQKIITTLKAPSLFGTDYVSTAAQTLAEEKKEQARNNIGAMPANTKIPRKTSELTNDSGFITSEDLPEIPESAVQSVNGKTGAVRLVASDVGALPDDTKIPAKTSDLTNNSGFITKAATDLANYYAKSQTYSREEIDQKMSLIPKFTISVVSSLPTSNISETTVYLVKSGTSGDLYTEYIYVNDTWEILGSQRVDLTGYATEAWVIENYPKADWVAKKTGSEGDTVWEEREITYASSDVFLADHGGYFKVTPGVEYAVYWNGKRYVCTAINRNGEYYIGNGKLVFSDMANTGEPFCFYSALIAPDTVFALKIGDSIPGVVTVKVTLAGDLVYDKMPAEYLPAEAVRSVNGEKPDENGNVEIKADEVTAEGVKNALGYTPADAEDVSELSEEIEDLQGYEPKDADIPRIFYGASLPQDKTETVMSFQYHSKTLDFNGYCETKAQGNSSLSFPKKNQTTKFFDDLTLEEKHKIAFKNWGKQNKFCMKANWIDITHSRNLVSARLWGDVVRSRANYDALPELLRTSPNVGAVDGFPVKAYANGVYQGRYTINIPKDKWMANMDDENPNHCILCGENYESGCFRAAALIDGSDWSDEVHDTVPENILARWNEVISFVMTATDEEFVANLDNYIDVESAIDYHLFGLVSCHNDGFGKNQLYLTYDGIKWYASVYDMDSTWGMSTMGGGLYSATYPRESYGDYNHSTGNLLYVRLAELFEDRILARWEELRNGALSVSNIINRFEEFVEICPPYVVEEDYATTTANGAFIDIPLTATNNIQQIRQFVVERLPYVHTYLSGETEEVNLWNLSERTDEDEFFATATEVININFAGYYTNFNRAGTWLSSEKLSGYPEVVVEGNDFTVTTTGTTDNNNSGYGIAVPMKLEVGATYRFTYDITGRGRLAISYYDANNKYLSNATLNNYPDGTLSVDTTVTIPECKFVIISGANNGIPGNANTTTTFRNIKIIKV